jgi:hypothetical protein
MTALITRTIRQAAFVVAFAASISEIPNIPAITACMKKNRANLSTGCRAVMDKEAAAEAGKVAAK